MDRPGIPCSLRILGGILVLSIVAGVGCRATKSEVPPGKAYARTAEQQPVVGFSSEPHPAPANAGSSSFNLGPGATADDRLAGVKSKQPTFGTPTAGERLAMPTGNRYGPPGTVGLDPTAGASPGAIADELLQSGESAEKSLTRDLKVSPASGDQ